VPPVVVDPERRESVVALMAHALVVVHGAHADRSGMIEPHGSSSHKITVAHLVTQSIMPSSPDISPP
jgi:hypothetical protein